MWAASWDFTQHAEQQDGSVCVSYGTGESVSAARR